MSNKPFDAIVLIGRFQPFHNGHAGLLQAALAQAGRVLIVLGSAHQARTARNPFTWEERAAMITASLDGNDAQRVSFIPIRNYYNDRRWAAAVEESVQQETKKKGLATRRVALAGHHKDESSYYLDLFPHWTFVALERQGDFDATPIRRIYFDAQNVAEQASLQKLVPQGVVRFLAAWSALPAFTAMQAEHRAIDDYKKKWGSGPFVTLDAIVTVAAHVLLVRRGNTPGAGLWALPGGFLEGRERLWQGAIRELKEETGLNITHAELEHALRGVAVFDHPERSQRGRVITHAHWFDLSLNALPDVAGADDAAEARWIPVAELAAMESRLFEDHLHILDHFLKVTG
ncbi:ADP-ribose pyrophosphatase [Betaproteobacteria bacterium]|nr:ADP-ribose pyrophosphatase [Betaproteobacteria bacterium]